MYTDIKRWPAKCFLEVPCLLLLLKIENIMRLLYYDCSIGDWTVQGVCWIQEMCASFQVVDHDVLISHVLGFYCSVVGPALPPSRSVAMERNLKTPFDRTPSLQLDTLRLPRVRKMPYCPPSFRRPPIAPPILTVQSIVRPCIYMINL
jgi:hypothetical protein